MPVTMKKAGPVPSRMAKLEGLPEYLTRGDLATLLEVHFETIKRWEREGKLPRASRFGPKTIRYNKAAIQKFLEAAE
jgi:excisionase family DNA binding protein